MVKPAYTIAMAAILMVAAFAGVALMDDEADAVDGEVYTVNYKVGNVTTSLTYASATVTLAQVSATEGENTVVMEDTSNFGGWIGPNGSTYSAGSSYTFPEGVTEATFTMQPRNVTIEFGDASDTTDVTVPYNTAVTIVIDDKKEDGTVTISESTVTVAAKNAKGQYFAGWATVEGGAVVYEAGTPVTASQNQTLYAVYEDDVQVNFYVDGTKLGTTIGFHSIGAADVSLPGAPSKTGYNFAGWKDAKGNLVYAYQLVDGQDKYTFVESYEPAEGIALYAIFEPIQLTITLMVGETEHGTAPALFGEPVADLALPPGYAAWCTREQVPVLDDEGNPVLDEAGNPTYKYEYTAFDFDTPITADLVLYAVESAPDENIYVTFNIEGTLYGPYAVNDRFSIPQTDREGYNFLGWTIQGGDGTRLTSEQVQNYQYTEDVTFVAIYEVAEPPAPEEPAFYETTTGQVAIIIVVFVLLLFGYAVYSNMGGLKDKLFGYTISKKEKKE